MRIEDISEADICKCRITLSATRDECTESNALILRNEVQLVNGSGVLDLLYEAARRLNESDRGVDWSRANKLRELASEIKCEEAVAAIANIHADKAGEVFAMRFELKKGGGK